VSQKEEARMGSTSHDDGFDFLLGRWQVDNRVLRPDGRWVTFPSRYEMHKALDGFATIDEWRLEEPPEGMQPFVGMTIRLFHPDTQRWSIRWVDTRRMDLLPPLFGSFRPDGSGEFFGEEEDDGELTEIRYVWSDTRTSTPLWEQSVRRRGEQEWVTNWVMQFSPVPDRV
jgi:hypothetical protein